MNPPSVRFLKVLLCENDVSFRNTFARFLEDKFSKQLEVVAVESVEEGWNYFGSGNQSHFDVIISDYKLGRQGLDGMDFYMRLYCASYEIPFILFSARSEKMIMQKNELNFYSFNKKSELDQLIGLLESLFPFLKG